MKLPLVTPMLPVKPPVGVTTKITPGIVVFQYFLYVVTLVTPILYSLYNINSRGGGIGRVCGRAYPRVGPRREIGVIRVTGVTFFETGDFFEECRLHMLPLVTSVTPLHP